jgi:hypothetical protein
MKDQPDNLKAVVDEYERFWFQVNESVNRLRGNSVAWKEYKEEVDFLQSGSNEVLDEPYFTPEEELAIRLPNRSSRRQR